MALTALHRFHSTLPDSTNPLLVNASNWNDSHVVSDSNYPTFAADFDWSFSPLAFTNLAIGNNTIVMDSLPPGVAAGGSAFISGGVGSSEVVPILSASGTSIVVTCANTHSGAWSIESIAQGVPEAITYLGGVGAIRLQRALGIAIHGTFIVPTSISLIGQFYDGTSATIGSIFRPDAGVSPSIIFADGKGTADKQGLGFHSNWELTGMGPGAGTGGLWIGGCAGFTNVNWTGSYLNFLNVQVYNVDTALTHRRGNFVYYLGCNFSGLGTGYGPALHIPSDSGGEHQPLAFYDTLLTVPIGLAIVMDDSGFATNMVQFYGRQISGTIGGNDIFIETWGTHFEPNEANVRLVSASGARCIFKAHGGLFSVHGTALDDMIHVTGTGEYVVSITDAQVQADVGMTVDTFVNFATTLKGAVRIKNNDFAAAGVFTVLLNINKTTLDANVTLDLDQPSSHGNTGVAAGAALNFPITAYPITQTMVIFGGTVGGGINVVNGMIPYSIIPYMTTSIQTFNATGSIAAAGTTVAGKLYMGYNNGTQFVPNI